MTTARTMLTRRRLLQYTSAGAAVLALAACAPAGTPTAGRQGEAAAPTGTKTTVRIASWDPVDSKPIEADVVAAFNQQYPEIEVVLEFNPDAYDDKLLTALAGGTAPDLFLWWNFPSLVARGGIQELTDLVAGPNGIDLGIYYQEVLDYNRVGGRLYGLPKDFTPRACFYNRKLFDAAGVAYPTGDWTTGDLLAMARALTVGEGPRAQYGFFAFSGLYDLQGYVWQNDGDFISPDGSQAAGYADSDATAAVLDWHAALHLKEKVAPSAQAFGGLQDGAALLFAAGKLAMYDTGRWPMALFKQVKGLDFGTCLPPLNAATGRRVTVLHEAGWCMNPATPLKDGAAWDVLRYMAGAEANKIRAEAGWALPALPAVAAELKMMEDPLEKTWFDAIPYATVKPCFMRTANWDKAGAELQVGIDTVFLGQASAKEAMAAAAAAGPILAGS